MKNTLAFIIGIICVSSVCAAPQTVIIRENGTGDYTSLETAVNAKEANLTGAAGGLITFRIDGAWASSDSLRCTFYNYKMSGSSVVFITAIGDARTEKVYSSNKYKLWLTAAENMTFPFTQSSSIVIVDGIQIGLSLREPCMQAIAGEYGYWGYLYLTNCLYILKN